MEISFFCLLVGLFVCLLFYSLETGFLFLGKLDRRLLTHADYWDLWGINLEQLECSHPLRQKIVKRYWGYGSEHTEWYNEKKIQRTKGTAWRTEHAHDRGVDVRWKEDWQSQETEYQMQYLVEFWQNLCNKDYKAPKKEVVENTKRQKDVIGSAE